MREILQRSRPPKPRSPHSLAIFRFHVETCVPEGIAKGDPERSERLAELVDIFDRFAK